MKIIKPLVKAGARIGLIIQNCFKSVKVQTACVVGRFIIYFVSCCIMESILLLCFPHNTFILMIVATEGKLTLLQVAWLFIFVWDLYYFESREAAVKEQFKALKEKRKEKNKATRVTTDVAIALLLVVLTILPVAISIYQK